MNHTHEDAYIIGLAALAYPGDPPDAQLAQGRALADALLSDDALHYTGDVLTRLGWARRSGAGYTLTDEGQRFTGSRRAWVGEYMAGWVTLVSERSPRPIPVHLHNPAHVKLMRVLIARGGRLASAQP